MPAEYATQTYLSYLKVGWIFGHGWAETGLNYEKHFKTNIQLTNLSWKYEYEVTYLDIRITALQTFNSQQQEFKKHTKNIQIHPQ